MSESDIEAWHLCLLTVTAFFLRAVNLTELFHKGALFQPQKNAFAAALLFRAPQPPHSVALADP